MTGRATGRVDWPGYIAVATSYSGGGELLVGRQAGLAAATSDGDWLGQGSGDGGLGGKSWGGGGERGRAGAEAASRQRSGRHGGVAGGGARLDELVGGSAKPGCGGRGGELLLCANGLRWLCVRRREADGRRAARRSGELAHGRAG
ncbi:uncharacterized protein LOC115669756 [Syzygium oleosum]|uniref:uncharacterized protein LOC115669756 n=1 Tax=Syzygium oleosum TaxID=219896 RepID=UPI0024B96DD4|nr:uncharacterized protein LOC115669756 [Syzygium oleosum]